MKYFRWIWFIFPVIALAKEPVVEQLFSVRTVEVQKIQSSHTKKHYGYVRADESGIYALSPRFGGYVEKLYANQTYQYIQKDAPLALVYSPAVYKAKEEYLSAYRFGKNQADKSLLNSAKRKLALLGITNQEIKDIIRQKSLSSFTTLRAPASGYIFEKNLMEGSAFNAKTKLFEITNLDTVWVEVQIFEDDFAWMKDAKRFQLHFKTTPQIYQTESKIFYPRLDVQKASITMRLSVKNSDHKLFPGMFASVISQDEPKAYLVLPQSAVILKNGHYYVFVVGDFKGEYEPKEVEVTPLDAEHYSITDGLREGDKVVNNALFMLDSDAQINGLY